MLEPWILLESNSIAKLNNRLAQMIPQHQPASEPSYSAQSIAVIGIACHFAGAENKEEFWLALKSGKGTAPVTASTQPNRKISGNEKHSPDRVFRFLRDIEAFDDQYFEINKETALHLDPAARQILETTARNVRMRDTRENRYRARGLESLSAEEPPAISIA